MDEPVMTVEDATKIMIQFLRAPDHGMFGKYGYDIYLPAVIITHMEKKGLRPEAEEYLRKYSPLFYAAGWDLCRRGILRPGVKKHGEQATNDGNAGNGYCITPFGKTWLAEARSDDFVPTEPERFGALLSEYKNLFGDGFHERGQQAIRCYGAHAYLACCAMCGAAAESILLALAVKKKGDEQEILKEYSSANGRHKIENFLIGKAQARIKEEFKGLINLLKYWRDESSHGRASLISDNEAYTSLAILLRFAMFANDNYHALIGTE
jgi:hypothetical protein